MDIPHIHHCDLAVMLRQKRHERMRVAVLYDKQRLFVINVCFDLYHGNVASREARILILFVQEIAHIKAVILFYIRTVYAGHFYFRLVFRQQIIFYAVRRDTVIKCFAVQSTSEIAARRFYIKITVSVRRITQHLCRGLIRIKRAQARPVMIGAVVYIFVCSARQKAAAVYRGYVLYLLIAIFNKRLFGHQIHIRRYLVHTELLCCRREHKVHLFFGKSLSKRVYCFYRIIDDLFVITLERLYHLIPERVYPVYLLLSRQALNTVRELHPSLPTCQVIAQERFKIIFESVSFSVVDIPPLYRVPDVGGIFRAFQLFFIHDRRHLLKITVFVLALFLFRKHSRQQRRTA